MSKRARTLILGVALAAMNLAAMTAVAHAYPLDPTSQRHRALGQVELLATADHAVASQQQNPTDAQELFRRGERASQEQPASGSVQRAAEAQERYHSTWGYGDTPAPVRPDEHTGQPDWLVLGLGVLAAALALSTGMAVLAARRANRRVRAGQTA
jgi:hypothetical protein